MRFMGVIAWFGAAVCFAAPVAFTLAAGQAADAVAPKPPTAGEIHLDRYLSIYEDLSAALSNVDNATDADLVAARVAADFLLLRGMDQALKARDESADSRLSADFLRSFDARREQAGTAVESAILRLRESNCHGSAALASALSLSRYIAGASACKEEAQTAVQELLANNMEMMLFLLDKVVDAESAAVVASLIESACQCKAALAAYAQELGEDDMDVSRRNFYAERRVKASSSILLRKVELESADFYGSEQLRECVDAVLLP